MKKHTICEFLKWILLPLTLVYGVFVFGYVATTGLYRMWKERKEYY